MVLDSSVAPGSMILHGALQQPQPTCWKAAGWGKPHLQPQRVVGARGAVAAESGSSAGFLPGFTPQIHGGCFPGATRRPAARRGGLSPLASLRSPLARWAGPGGRPAPPGSLEKRGRAAGPSRRRRGVPRPAGHEEGGAAGGYAAAGEAAAPRTPPAAARRRHRPGGAAAAGTAAAGRRVLAAGRPAGGAAHPLRPLRHLPGREPRGPPDARHPARPHRRPAADPAGGDQQAPHPGRRHQDGQHPRGHGGGLRLRRQHPGQPHGPALQGPPAGQRGGRPPRREAGGSHGLQPALEQLRALRHLLPLRRPGQPADRQVLRDREDDHPRPEERARLSAGGLGGGGLPGPGALYHAAHHPHYLLAVDGRLTAFPRARARCLYIGCTLLYL